VPLIVKEYQSTPNPNALKCVVDRAIAPLPGPPATLRSYSSPAAAASDPLATALFAIPGVRSVLVHAPGRDSSREPGWISINKSADADWRTLKPAIERVLQDQP
jgi:hypothetical protein